MTIANQERRHDAGHEATIPSLDADNRARTSRRDLHRTPRTPKGRWPKGRQSANTRSSQSARNQYEVAVLGLGPKSTSLPPWTEVYLIIDLVTKGQKVSCELSLDLFFLRLCTTARCLTPCLVISFEFVLRNHPDCFENLPGLSSLIRDYDIVHAAAAWKLNQNDTGYTRFQNVKTQMTALKEAIRLGTIVHVQDKNQPSRQVEWQESHPQGPWRHVIKLEDNRVMLDKIDETEQLKSSWHDNKGMIRLVLESLQRLFRIPADSRIQEEAFSTHTVAWRLQPDPDMMTAENDRSVPEPVMNGDGDEALFGENPLEYVNFDEEANKPDGLPVKGKYMKCPSTRLRDRRSLIQSCAGIVLIKFWSQRSTGEWVKSWGSGWILNRETVVTNGHCVVGRDKRATSAMIYVGYDEGGIGTNGTPKAKETVAGTHVLVQWAYFRRRDRTYDIALIKMATEFKIGRLIEWKPTPRQQEHEIIVAGYPKPDVSEGRRMKKSQGSCTAVESTIEHLFDTLPGKSFTFFFVFFKLHCTKYRSHNQWCC